MFNENKLDEMSHILDHYMTLVPTVEIEGHHKLPNGSEIDFDDTRFFSIIFGGDQLTVARMRGVQALRDTHSKRADRFEGLIPVVEDWHARMTVMKVSKHPVSIICAFSVKFYTSCRYCGVVFTRLHQVPRRERCTSCEILFTGPMFQRIPKKI